MKIEAVQRNNFIDSLFVNIRSNERKLSEMKHVPAIVEKRTPIYVRCPIYDEDIEVDPQEDGDY